MKIYLCGQQLKAGHFAGDCSARWMQALIDIGVLRKVPSERSPEFHPIGFDLPIEAGMPGWAGAGRFARACGSRYDVAGIRLMA